MKPSPKQLIHLLTYGFLLFSLAFQSLRVEAQVEGYTESQLKNLVSNFPEAKLNRLMYESTHSISCKIKYHSLAQMSSSPNEVIIMSTSTHDLERVTLKENKNLLTKYTTRETLPRLIKGSTKPKTFNGELEVNPNDIIVAVVGFVYQQQTGKSSNYISYDFGIVFDPEFKASPVHVEPGITMFPDEADAQKYGKSNATLAIVDQEEFVTGMTAIDEFLFAPKSGTQLSEFLQLTGGEVIKTFGDKTAPDWVEVKVSSPAGHGKYLAQLRNFFGDETHLVASRSEALDMYAYGLELMLQGFRVAFNPVVSQMNNKSSEDSNLDAFNDPNNEILSTSFLNPVFGMRETWSAMAMWDADLKSINAGIIDIGFKPNDDWRGPVVETDVVSGDKGTGEATGPGYLMPGDDSRMWHGTGVTSIAGSMLNNGIGTVGTGGQVLVPNIYKINTTSSIFDIASYGALSYLTDGSEAITLAVEDGVSVINCSFGYPCRILWTLGPDNLCTTAGRLAFYAKLEIISSTIKLICKSAVVLPGGVLIAWICSLSATAFDAVKYAAGLLLLVIDTRGVMEAAIEEAKEKGIPVVASAGNVGEVNNVGILKLLVSEEMLGKTDVDEWQIIPCVIPDVICVGSCYPDADWTLDGDATESSVYYMNWDFYGSSVDVWAPIPSTTYQPDDSDTEGETPGISPHFKGTSASAPYVSGLIANMMSINDDINPAKKSESSIVDEIADVLTESAYYPGDGATDFAGNEILPVSSGVTVETDVASSMDHRRNMINPYKAWTNAAFNADLGWNVIPDVASYGFDTDYGHENAEKAADEGDDVADEFGSATELVTSKSSPFSTVTDEINFIWPSPHPTSEITNLVHTDVDFFNWTSPKETILTSLPILKKMYRQKFVIKVPDYPKSLPWMNLEHGVKLEIDDLQTFQFTTPWLASGEKFPMYLSMPPYTDSPFKLELQAYESSAYPDTDTFDQLTDSNDDYTSAAYLEDEFDWTETPSTVSESFEQTHFNMTAPRMSLDSPMDVDWYELHSPAIASYRGSECGGMQSSILWIQVLPLDPNISIEVYAKPLLGEALKAPLITATGNQPVRVGCGLLGVGTLDASGLLIKIASLNKSMSDYTLAVRLSIPVLSFGGCWECITTSNFEFTGMDGHPSKFSYAGPSNCAPLLSGHEPEFDWFRKAQILPELTPPDYPTLGISPNMDMDGRLINSPILILLDHSPDRPIEEDLWVSAFLGHDQDFSGNDQSLRMDIFSVVNCNWLGGVIVKDGALVRMGNEFWEDHDDPPYAIGDVDLYLKRLDEGSYMLAITYFKEGDYLDLVFSKSCSAFNVVTTENAHDGSGSSEAVLGPWTLGDIDSDGKVDQWKE